MKEIFDEEKISKYMNNDEAVIVMDKKDFENNYISKSIIIHKMEKLINECFNCKYSNLDLCQNNCTVAKTYRTLKEIINER